MRRRPRVSTPVLLLLAIGCGRPETSAPEAPEQKATMPAVAEVLPRPQTGGGGSGGQMQADGGAGGKLDTIPRFADAAPSQDAALAPDARPADAHQDAGAMDARPPVIIPRTDAGGVAAVLHGARWDIPCPGMPKDTGSEIYLCTNVFPMGMKACPRGQYYFIDQTVTFGGTKGTVYDVTLRFRGSMETGDYQGGTVDTGGFRTGGAVQGGNIHWGIGLWVSSPMQVYFPNSRPGRLVQKVDHTRTIQIEGGATIRMTAQDSDCAQRVYPDPSIPGVDGPGPLGGNYMQIDVLSVATAR